MSVILVGGFIETVELAESLSITIDGIIDRHFNEALNRRIEYLGDDSAILEASFREKYSNASIFLTPDLPKVRKKLFDYYLHNGWTFQNLISKDCRISGSAQVPDHASTMIQFNVHISANVRLGKCVRVNTMANIMHDCVIGDFVTIAPNAVLLGAVTVESGVYVGANATILPGLHIGANAVIGAGAVVTKDVSADDVVVGVPAKTLVK